MKIICAGWGRTGTRSLKRSLEILTGQPSYHMQNILLNKKMQNYGIILFSNIKVNLIGKKFILAMVPA